MSTKAATSTPEEAPGSGPDTPRLRAASVAVLAGGASGEREVSLASGAAVARALRARDGALDQRGPGRVVEVELLAGGRWRLGDRAVDLAGAIEGLGEFDVAFSVLHGGAGEDGTVQGLLQMAGVPCAGSDVRASAVCMDKVFTRELLARQGLAVAPAEVVTLADWRAGAARPAELLGALGTSRCVVKPRSGGSSVGTAIAADESELRAAIEAALRWEDEVLLEAFVPGVEVTGAVVVDPSGVARAFTPIEIQPHAGRFFDYDEKYSDGGALELCPPESLAPAVVERVRELSLCAHDTLRCRGYSRTDFIVPEGADEPLVLEVNTLPGFTARSLVPQAAAHDGVDFRTLCLWITDEALRRSRP